MRLAERLSVRIGADHLTRDPVPYPRAAGFVIESVERTGRGGVTFRILACKLQCPCRRSRRMGIEVARVAELDNHGFARTIG